MHLWCLRQLHKRLKDGDWAIWFFTRLLVLYVARDLITLYPVYLCLYITLSDVFFWLRSEEFLYKQTWYTWHMTPNSIPTLYLTQISKFELFPSVSEVQWWVFIRLNSTSSSTNKYLPKVIIFGYFSLHTWRLYCFYMRISSRSPQKHHRNNSIFPRPWFQKGHFLACLKPNISGSIYPFDEWYISLESSRKHIFEKNGDCVICILSQLSPVFIYEMFLYPTFSL